MKNTKKLRVYIPLAVIVMAVLTGVFFWYRDYRRYIKTDDAHLESDDVSVSPKILGRITSVLADEGDTVKEGTLLVVLDSTDLTAQKSQAEAAQGQAIANQVQAGAKLAFDKESLKVQEVNLARAREDFDRAKAQYAGEVITKEQFDHAQKNFESAKAMLDAARSQLTVSEAQVGSAAAAVKSAQSQVKVIGTQLHNTRIYAPITGLVAKRWLLPGDVAQPGQPVLTLTDNHKVWVTVYLEETKMKGVFPGQKVLFSIDTYPGVTFYGKVYSIASTTASQFSLIPPNNASGNFTKVTQRVPLKVSIDGAEGHESLKDFNLLAGMSAEVRIVRN